MLRVALTGGAASGKSAAAAMFAEMGAFVSQSDEIARAMMQPGEAVFDRICEHFGSGVVGRDGTLDRRLLAKLAFEDGRVEELNAIVHAPVIAAQAAWMREMGWRYPDAVLVVESALIFETRHGGAAQGSLKQVDVAEDAVDVAASGGVMGDDVVSAPWRTRFDRIVLVTAAEPLRVKRYVSRALLRDSTADRDALERDARARFAMQMPEERKAMLSDFVLRNDGTPEQLREEVVTLFPILQGEARTRTRAMELW